MMSKCMKSQKFKSIQRKRNSKEKKASPNLKMNKKNLSSCSAWLKRWSRCSNPKQLQLAQKKNTSSVKSLQRNSWRKQKKRISTVKRASSDQSCQWQKKIEKNWSTFNGCMNLLSARIAKLPAISFAWACQNIIPCKRWRMASNANWSFLSVTSAFQASSNLVPCAIIRKVF